MTKTKGFGSFSIAVYWKRKYKGKNLDEPWYILTNLGSCDEAITAYKARSGIEVRNALPLSSSNSIRAGSAAMFKDCKTGGYNLEGSKASVERLTRLVLLIAIAYTSSGLQGLKIKQLGQQKYISRLQGFQRSQNRHSNFWVGFYGLLWIVGMEFWADQALELMRIKSNKLPFFQRGQAALNIVQSIF